MNVKKFALFIILLIKLASYQVIAGNDIKKFANSAEESEPSYFSVAYFFDKNDQDSSTTPISHIINKPFTSITNNHNFSLNHKIVWYKIDIKNSTQVRKELYLHNNLAYMSRQVDIFEFSGKQLLNETSYKLMQASIAKQLQGSTLVYPLSLTAGESKTIYIKNETLAHQMLDVEIHNNQDSIRALINKNFYSNAIIIILFALAFYNSMLFLFSRAYEFIYYSLYLINAGIGLFYMYGSVFHNLGIYGEQVYWMNITAILVPLFLILFVKSIFDISTKTTINHLFNLVIALCIINLLIAVLFDLSLALKLVFLIFFFSFIVLIYSGAVFYKQNHPLAKIFILAYGIYVVTFSITILALMGVLPYNVFSLHASGIGLVIEALLFSYLLHYRIQLLEQEVVKQKDRLILKNKKSQMGDMIAAITHQWKQPLTAISSITTLLQYRVDDQALLSSKELKPKLAQINDKVHFLVETIEDFRQFFKPDNIYQKTDIGQLINRAISLSHDEMLASNISINTELNFTETISVYQNELLHIILNLIQNSKEAFKDNPVTDKLITIIGYNKNGLSIIEVIDNAGGILPEYLPQIFDEFFTTKDKQEGTGLGLYLSKFILEQHMNAKIEADNFKKGMIFRISIG